MQEEESKLPISVWEIILLVILTPVVFYGGLVFLLFFSGGLTSDLFLQGSSYRMLPTLLTVTLVLGFDVGWITLVVGRSWLVKDKRAKVYLTVLVLTLSASVLTAIYAVGQLHAAFV